MLSEPSVFPIFYSVFSAHSVLKSEKPNTKPTESHGGAQNNAVRLQMRGTSGTPRRTKRSRYRCSLPGLAGFAGLRRTEPEVPRIGSRFTSKRLPSQSSTATRAKKTKPDNESCPNFENFRNRELAADVFEFDGLECDVQEDRPSGRTIMSACLGPLGPEASAAETSAYTILNVRDKQPE